MLDTQDQMILIQKYKTATMGTQTSGSMTNLTIEPLTELTSPPPPVADIPAPPPLPPLPPAPPPLPGGS